MESKSLVNFKNPSAADRKQALGAMGGTPFKLKKALEGVENYWAPIRDPEPNDWLANEFESGQGYQDFLCNKNAFVEKGKQDMICILPLDKKMSLSFLKNMQKMCQAFFLGCQIKILPSIEFQDIDKLESRVVQSEYNGTEHTQYNASKILSWLFRVYKPKYPKAICFMAITTEDIYPEDPQGIESFSYVFGLANVMTQSGIFSFYRYDPAFNGDQVSSQEEADNIILYRACKVMTHEIGHMFGIRHCIYYECGMNGSNHIQECESRPMYFCAVCFRKLATAVGFDPVERYEKLIEICQEFGGRFEEDGLWFQRRCEDLKKTFQKLIAGNIKVNTDKKLVKR
eukprot:403350867